MIFYVPGGKYELMLPPPTPPGQPMVTGVPNLRSRCGGTSDFIPKANG